MVLCLADTRVRCQRFHINRLSGQQSQTLGVVSSFLFLILLPICLLLTLAGITKYCLFTIPFQYAPLSFIYVLIVVVLHKGLFKILTLHPSRYGRKCQSNFRDGNALKFTGSLEGHRLGIVSVDINKPGTIAVSASLDNQASQTFSQCTCIFPHGLRQILSTVAIVLP